MSFFSAGPLAMVMLILLLILVVTSVLLLIRQNAQKQAQRYTAQQMEGSIRQMGEMLSRSHSEAVQIQSRRLSEMNQEMNSALRQLSRNIGEMQSLASGVEDLKKVFSNVKSRGIVGEVQLGAILEDVLSPEQYEENAPVTGTTERVEYAVRLPGDGNRPCYLPIDSKFPGDAYMNLMDAYELGDGQEIKVCRDQLRRAILKAASDIRNKYIAPPLTTDFAIMFLPFEGLYAEVLRLNLTSQLLSEYRVNVAGPTTMAAMLSSFRMGFRSMAISERSGQVWDTLMGVTTEFAKFEETLDKTQKHLRMAQKDLDELVGPRTRQIRKAMAELTQLDENR